MGEDKTTNINVELSMSAVVDGVLIIVNNKLMEEFDEESNLFEQHGKLLDDALRNNGKFKNNE